MNRLACRPGSFEDAVTKLHLLGYGFNDAGQLRQIDRTTDAPGEKAFVFEVCDDHDSNQKHYEKLAENIPHYVYNLLEQNGLTRMPMPLENPEEQRTFYFSKPADLKDSRKLLILIHGTGYVRAGQWARSLIINNSLDEGTQIPYIKQAATLGYDVLVMNTNDTKCTIDGITKDIPLASTPEEHAAYIMEKVIKPAHPEAVALVAHSYGGYVAFFMAMKNIKFFESKVFGIALTDACVPKMQGDLHTYANKVGRNWVASSQPLDSIMPLGGRVPCVSAGHIKHEFTSHAAKDSVFAYLEQKYEAFKKTHLAENVNKNSESGS